MRQGDGEPLFRDVAYQRRDVSSLPALMTAVEDCLDDNWDFTAHGSKQKLGFCFVYDLMAGGLTLPPGVDPKRLARFLMGTQVLRASSSAAWNVGLVRQTFFIYSYMHDNPAAKWPRMNLAPDSTQEDKCRVFAAIFALCHTLAAKDKDNRPNKPTRPPLTCEMNRSLLARVFNRRYVWLDSSSMASHLLLPFVATWTRTTSFSP